MTATDERVAIRRKSDGKWAAKGGGTLPFFHQRPTPLRSLSAAHATIRADWGGSLGDYDVVPWADVPAEIK